MRGVDFLLIAREGPIAARGGVEQPPALRDLDCRPAALVGGVGQGVDPGCVEALDQTMPAGGAHVMAGTGKRA